MNVFVLCTGRCGSLSFAKACAHARNYTSAHESNWKKSRQNRLDYPDQHIEVDNRLSWMLGSLDKRYGPNAIYVHLTRDAGAVAKSFDRRWGKEQSIIQGYADSILCGAERNIDTCRSLVDCVTDNIELFLRDKPSSLSIDIAQIEQLYPVFWKSIAAEGNLSAAMAEFSKLHNASEKKMPARGKIVTIATRLPLRLARRLVRRYKR